MSTQQEFTPTEAVFREDVTVELIDSMGSEESIVRAARVSTKGADSRGAAANKGLVRYLYREKHGVPFESCLFTFYFEVPIAVSRQIVKHRISSINEESGRYKELSGVFYLPREGRKLAQVGKTSEYTFEDVNPEMGEIFRTMMRNTAETGWYNYQSAIHNVGIAKEVARFLLPTSMLYSSMYFTTNLRSVLNFLSLRKDWGDTAKHQSKPQDEIELVSNEIAKIVEEKFPTVWEMFVASGYEAV